MSKKNTIIHFTILSLIVILAFVVRIYNIDSVPSGIYPDEANNGTNAFDAMQAGHYPWFYPDNNGREGLFLNIIALLFKFFGVSVITLKLPAIMMGTLTVIGVYFLARELFISKPRLALIASYLTAVSFWAINFSRISFRANMMLPVLTFAFYFFFRGIRTKKILDFIISGAIFGLGFHTYIAFRIAPALAIVLFILLTIQGGRTFLRNYWTKILTFILCAGVVASPIFYTFHQHPEYLTSRSGDISVFAPSQNTLIETLLHTVSTSLLKYNVHGDQNWRHGLPSLPTLEPLVGIMFFCGILLSAWLFIYFFYRRIIHKTTNRKLVTHGFLIAWFFAFLAPEFMTTEGLPHSLRSLGTLPVAYIFAAFFINYLLERAQHRSHKHFIFTSVLTITLLVYVGFFGIMQYHVLWATSAEQAHAFNKNLTDIAHYIPTLPTATPIYVVTSSMERLPIRLLNIENKNIIFIEKNEIDKIDTTQFFYLIAPYETDIIISSLSQKSTLTIEPIITSLESSFTLICPLK